jgi:hypothetical protein
MSVTSTISSISAFFSVAIARPIRKRLHRHSCRQSRRDRRQPRLHVLDHLIRILPIAHDDDPADDFAPVHIERTTPEIPADPHRRQISQI